MKKKGDYEYREEAATAILNCVTHEPQTTNDITRSVQARYFKKAHFVTVKRVLQQLAKGGKIRMQEVGRFTLWNL